MILVYTLLVTFGIIALSTLFALLLMPLSRVRVYYARDRLPRRVHTALARSLADLEADNDGRDCE